MPDIPHVCYDKRAGWKRSRGGFDMSVTETAVCGIRDRGTTNRPDIMSAAGIAGG